MKFLLMYLITLVNIKPQYFKNSGDFLQNLNTITPYKLVTVYPAENLNPQDSSLIRIGYSSRELYIYVSNFQKGIQASTRKKDSENLMGDDWLLVFLDVQGRGNEAYCFQINPIGTKRDFVLTGGGANVEEWDGDWDVMVKERQDGWDALITIPFSSISYAKTDWGIQIERYIAAKCELQLLVKLPSFQQIKGIATLKPDFELLSSGGNLYSLTPIVELRLESEKPGDEKRELSLRYGGTLRFKEGTGTLLDFTFKPDFSDVDADIEEINFERLPVNYPEKRPFFMEGKDLIATPVELVRTRNIEYPEMGLKFYSKGEKLSFAGFFVKDSVFDYVAFSRFTYSPCDNFLIGTFNVLSESNFSLSSMDMNVYIPRWKMDITAQAGRRMDTPSNLLYWRVGRRQEFKGFGFSFSYLDIDSAFLSPLNYIFFDGIRKYEGYANYQFLLSGINVALSMNYGLRKDKYHDTLISEEYTPGITIVKAPFSLGVGVTRAQLEYAGLPDTRYNTGYISLGYSLSSWKSVSFTLMKGEYFGSCLRYLSTRFNLSPLNKFNIGFQGDFVNCEIMPEKNIYQIFGEIPLRENLILKTYVNYKVYQGDMAELAFNGVLSFEINTTTGVYLGFTKSLYRLTDGFEEGNEKVVLKVKAGYDIFKFLEK